MKRRDFSKHSLLMGLGAMAGCVGDRKDTERRSRSLFKEPSRALPVREFDVVVAGAGTAGVVAALASARKGVRTALIEAKGYPGGTVVEGGTALHSYYNLWKAFPGVPKRQVVKGIPQEIVDRLVRIGAATGFPEMERGFDYDSVCTAIDTELYKLVIFEMLQEAGVFICVNTLLVGALMDGPRIEGAIVESRSGRELFRARAFVDCTAYGDLAAFAGAQYTEPNDYDVCNSLGMANVNIEKFKEFLETHNALDQLARGKRSGVEGQIIRLSGDSSFLPEPFRTAAHEIGLALTTTTPHDNYFMFLKLNMKMPVSPTNRDEVAKAELELRWRQYRAVELFRTYVPGCEKAFIARTSPSLNIRRGRLVTCDHDISRDDVLNGRHFKDEVLVYGFHDNAPRLKIRDGGTYGIPYRALRPKGLENLLVSGMMITSDIDAHMSTRNTVCCMGQGQASGTAAALCASKRCGTRDLNPLELRDSLKRDGVYFET